MTDVSKISIWTLVIYFAIYLILHFLIINWYMKVKQEATNGLADTQEEKDKLAKKSNRLRLLVRWFPAIYVVFLIFVFAL